MELYDIIGTPDEKPLDRIVSDGGFVGIFRTIACVGDSLASGEFELKDPKSGEWMYLDRYDYSWGQFLGRMAGSKVYNFSKGGMTAKEYMTSYANRQGFWNPALRADAYVIALGVNDLLNRKWELGDMSDVCLEDYTKNKETFVGYYAAIIQKYKTIAPDAHFFLVTFPKGRRGGEPGIIEKAIEALYAMAEMFDNTYVIDLMKYGVEYDAEWGKMFKLNGHLNAAGYMFSAKVICSYMDYIIRHNFEKFKTVGTSEFEYDRNFI